MDALYRGAHAWQRHYRIKRFHHPPALLTHTQTRAQTPHTHTGTHFYLNLEPSLGRGKEGEGVGGEGGEGGGGEGRRGRVAYILLSQTHIWKEGERCAH